MADENARRWLRALRQSGATWKDCVAALLEEVQEEPPPPGKVRVATAEHRLLTKLADVVQGVLDIAREHEIRDMERCPNCDHPKAWHVLRNPGASDERIGRSARCSPPPSRVVVQDGSFRVIGGGHPGGQTRPQGQRIPDITRPDGSCLCAVWLDHEERVAPRTLPGAGYRYRVFQGDLPFGDPHAKARERARKKEKPSGR